MLPWKNSQVWIKWFYRSAEKNNNSLGLLTTERLEWVYIFELNGRRVCNIIVVLFLLVALHWHTTWFESHYMCVLLHSEALSSRVVLRNRCFVPTWVTSRPVIFIWTLQWRPPRGLQKCGQSWGDLTSEIHLYVKASYGTDSAGLISWVVLRRGSTVLHCRRNELDMGQW